MKSLSNIDKKVYLYRPLLDTKKKFLVKISKNIFGKFIKDPSNKNKKFLRTKVRSLKKPLENSGIKYEQIFRSIQNLSLSKTTLDNHFNKIFKRTIKKRNNEIFIDCKNYNNFTHDIKIAVINESVKQLKKNYYDLRAKKVDNLVKFLETKDFKKATLGGCIFSKKGNNFSIKLENS